MEMKKCAHKSDEWLREAQRCVDESNLYEALIFLNKSLCFTPVNSSALSLIYARRAKIFRDLNQLQKSLENVELARAAASQIDAVSIYEEITQLKSHLNGTSEQKDCTDDDPWKFFRLSNPPHKKLPFVVDCLKVQDTWKYGRCVISTKTLQPGEVVVIEEPFMKMLNKNARYMRCANCMKSNLMSLLPCPHHCTTSEELEKSIEMPSNILFPFPSTAMFCSTSCLRKAWQRFHQFECSALDNSLNNDNEYDIMVLKTVFEALDICGSPANLKDFLSESELNLTAFDFDLCPAGRDYEKKLLKVMYSLKKGPSSPEDLSMAEWIVNSFPALTLMYKTNSERKFLKNFVIRIMGIIDRNSYVFYSPSLKVSYVDEEIGSGVFPFASLINHSCAPNLYRIFVDNKQVFVVKMPIQPGEQLFVGYHGNFSSCTRVERQNFLRNDFQFKCSCKACTQDYPLMNALRKYDPSFKVPPAKVNSSDEAKAILMKNFQFVKDNIKRFPSFEVCSVMQNTFRQLQFIAGKSFLVEKL